MAVSLEQFSTQLVDSGAISSESLRAYLDKLPATDKPADGEQLAKRLVKDKQISAYQAQAIYSGKGKSLTMGGYFVLDKLGQGGMGMVLKAEHRMMKRLVAIKVLSPAVTKTKELSQRFQREVEAAARLTHPNIVRAFDAGDSHGSPFLVLEFVPGTDLSSLVKKLGPLSVEQAIDCITQAARGLEFAHSKGVIHRDIKPANLLLDTRGIVKILDMGLARIDAPDVATQANLTGTGTVMGTIDYMAPEQALSTRDADARSDLYSLGISLWYLLTGVPAYPGESVMARLLAHRDQPVPSLRNARTDVPESLDRVFRKLAAKNPADRYQSATELIVDLQVCRSGAGRDVAPVTEASAAADIFATTNPNELAPQNPATVKPGATAKDVANLNQTRPVPIPIIETALELNTRDARRHRRSAERKAPLPHWLRNRRAQIGGAVAALALLLATAYLLSTTSRVDTSDSAERKADRGALTNSTRDRSPAGVSSPAAKTPDPQPVIAPFDASQARAAQEAWARALGVPVEYTNRTGMTFRLIPPGEFEMGAAPDAIDEMVKTLQEDMYVKDDTFAREVIRSGAPRHRVKLTRPFFLGTHEVTQHEYQFVTGFNPSCFSAAGRRKDLSVKVDGQETGKFPVEDVSWYDAVSFCNALSESEGFQPIDRNAGSELALGDAAYRLPTEAEWEFACRAGTTTRFWTGDQTESLKSAAWSALTSLGRTHPVGELQPNPFGLFDIHGHVSEYVEDGWDQTFYSRSSGAPAVDPFNSPSAGSRVVVRGSNWYFHAPLCDSGARFAHDPTTRLESVGFRVVMTVAAVKAAIEDPQAVEKHDEGYALAFTEPGGVSVPSLRRDDTGPLTIEMRLKLRRSGGVAFCIDGRAACQIQPDGGAEAIVAVERLAGDGRQVRAPYPNDGWWRHVAYVLRDTEVLLFIDGRVVSRTPRDPAVETSPAPSINAGTFIGTQRYADNDSYHTIAGSIDELRISRIARYEADFVPERRFTSDADTTALYHCDEGGGEILRDSSGNDHHGKILKTRWESVFSWQKRPTENQTRSP